MNMKFRFGAAGVALVSAFGLAASAHAATANADATAQILDTLQIDNTADLDFGQVGVTGAGTVTVSTAGAATCSVNLVCAGTSSAAAFTVEGTANTNVSIVLDNISNLSGPGADLVLSALTSSAGASLALDGSGAGSFTVGGTIAVAANQTPGVYNGSFDATVEYE